MTRLTKNDIERIEDLIRLWSNRKLTWNLLVTACNNELGIKTTRKTLNTRSALKTAMKLRKAELKAPSQYARQYTDIDRANDRIIRLSKRVEELEAAQNVMIDKFTRWAFNADAHGLSESILDRPIPILKGN